MTVRERIEEIRALREEEIRSDDIDDRIGIRRRIDERLRDLGRYVEDRGSPDDVLDHILSVAVDRWHEHATTEPLAEWVGLTNAQYAAYVECRFDDLVRSLQTAKSSRPS